MSNTNDSILDSNCSSSGNTSHIIDDTFDNNKPKSKKAKIKKSPTPTPLPEPSQKDIITTNNNNNKMSKNTHINILGIDYKKCTPIISLFCMIKTILQRTSSYTAVMLFDVVKPLSTQFTTILIRLLLYYIMNNDIQYVGNRNNDTNTSSTHNNMYLLHDEIIKRAIIWVEALLDSHFINMSYNLNLDKFMYFNIYNILHTISVMEDTVDDLEGLLGLCSHVKKQINNNTINKPNMYSVYEVEDLVL